MYRRFLSLPETALWVGVSKSTVLRWAEAGLFPPKVRLGPNRISWDLHALERWAEERATGAGVSVEPGSVG